MISYLDQKYVSAYLFEREMREKELESPIHGLAPQVSTNAFTGQSQSKAKSLELHLYLLHGWQGLKYLSHLLMFSQER